MKKTYAIINYGCQMNESDSEHYAGQLLDLGYEASADYEHADVVVINTCCVRENAEKKILGKIGEMKRLKRENPDSESVRYGSIPPWKNRSTALCG